MRTRKTWFYQRERKAVRSSNKLDLLALHPQLQPPTTPQSNEWTDRRISRFGCIHLRNGNITNRKIWKYTTRAIWYKSSPSLLERNCPHLLPFAAHTSWDVNQRVIISIYFLPHNGKQNSREKIVRTFTKCTNIRSSTNSSYLNNSHL